MTPKEREKIRHLLVIQDLQGRRTVPLREATYSIGRDSRNSIVLYSQSVSRQHALLLRVTIPETKQCLFRIVDGNLKGNRSTNGLLVNGKKCFSHDLRHEDRLEFGYRARAKYYAVSNLSDAEFTRSCQTEDLSNFLADFATPFETLVTPNDAENSREALLARLASFPELIPNPIVEIELTGAVTYLNPAAVQEFPHLKDAGFAHPILADLPALVHDCEKTACIRQVESDGRVFEESIHYLPESDLIRIFLIDITERKQAERELYQRERLLQAVAEATSYLLSEADYDTAINKALAILGQATDVDRLYIFEHSQSPSEEGMKLRFQWCQGTDNSTVLACWPNQLYKLSSANVGYQALFKETIGKTIGELSEEEQKIFEQNRLKSILVVPIFLKDRFWGCISFADCRRERHWTKHERTTLVTVATSISGTLQRQQTEQLIRYRALHDLLTGLPNRTLFNEHLAKALANRIRSGKILAVMFLDLDQFKIINDTLGHAVGDCLLQEVAQRLHQALRVSDTVARWGGDEFIILLPEVNQLVDIKKTAERILQALDSTFHLEGHELSVTTSIGIALANEDSNAEALIKHADIALYRAKEQGRNNYQIYQAVMSAKAPERLTLENNLRLALERQEFVLNYQPIIDMATGAIAGVEALLRWHHTEMGWIAPDTFIPLAEENGLIVPLGEWVLRTACHQNRAWQEAGLAPITVAINLSLQQFRHPKLVETVSAVLAETGLEPHLLELEITETAAIQNLEFTVSILQNLNNMGIRLAIDDFGTGHSSLSRLQLLPVHRLKIDRSFVQDLLRDCKVSHIVKAIVALGQSLGLTLIAEGVESQEQLDFLKSIGCEAVQGFFFYAPMSAQEATETLQISAIKRLMQSVVDNQELL